MLRTRHIKQIDYDYLAAEWLVQEGQRLAHFPNFLWTPWDKKQLEEAAEELGIPIHWTYKHYPDLGMHIKTDTPTQAMWELLQLRKYEIYDKHWALIGTINHEECRGLRSALTRVRIGFQSYLDGSDREHIWYYEFIRDYLADTENNFSEEEIPEFEEESTEEGTSTQTSALLSN